MGVMIHTSTLRGTVPLEEFDRPPRHTSLGDKMKRMMRWFGRLAGVLFGWIFIGLDWFMDGFAAEVERQEDDLKR